VSVALCDATRKLKRVGDVCKIPVDHVTQNLAPTQQIFAAILGLNSSATLINIYEIYAILSIYSDPDDPNEVGEDRVWKGEDKVTQLTQGGCWNAPLARLIGARAATTFISTKEEDAQIYS